MSITALLDTYSLCCVAARGCNSHRMVSVGCWGVGDVVADVVADVVDILGGGCVKNRKRNVGKMNKTGLRKARVVLFLCAKKKLGHTGYRWVLP